MRTKIYILTDDDGKIRYLGKTSHTLRSRFYNHLWVAQHGGKYHIYNWIRLLIKQGRCPRITLVGEVDGNGNRDEIAWIKYLRNEGHNLTNVSSGGDGGELWRNFKEVQKKQRQNKRHPCHKVINLWKDEIFLRSVEYSDKETNQDKMILPYQSTRNAPEY